MGCKKKVYTLTVTDTNNEDTGGFETYRRFCDKTETEYTFTSRQMMMDPVLFEFRKEFRWQTTWIWGRPGYQTI